MPLLLLRNTAECDINAKLIIKAYKFLSLLWIVAFIRKLYSVWLLVKS